jgi:exonuclease SbcC
MIKYDYLIERNESDETRTYVPSSEIGKTLEDIVYIQGPNSSGKSTLLNLVALAFWGDKLNKEELNPALREKVRNLSEADHQKIEFKIEISNAASGITLVAKKSKGSPEIERRRIDKQGKDKPLTFDQFKKEYRLIYDIPHDPLSRLPLLLNEIKYAQKDCATKIGQLRHFLTTLISEVREGKDPDKLSEMQSKLLFAGRELDRLGDLEQNKTEELSAFADFFALKDYRDGLFALTDLKEKIDRLQTHVTKETKKEDKQSKEIAELMRKLSSNISLADAVQQKILILLRSLLPKGQSHRIDLWKQANCAKEMEMPDDYRGIKDESLFFHNHFTSQLNNDPQKQEEAEFLKLLLELVEKYTRQNFEIPGTNQSAQELTKHLKVRYNQFKDILIKKEQINNLLAHLEEIGKYIREGTIQFNDLRVLHKKRGETFTRLNEGLTAEELIDAKEQLNALEDEFQRTKAELIKRRIDPEQYQELLDVYLEEERFVSYETYSKNQANTILNELEEELSKAKRDLEHYNRQKVTLDADIKRLEERGPHKYQNYLPQLESTLRNVQQLEQKIGVKFNENVSSMIDSDISSKTMDLEEKAYAEAVEKFLAAKIRTIRHINKSYNVKRVDVINKVITTDNNKKIKFVDLGTGQSQGAYLEGLLSINDNKKVIALFDEVAMMDSSTLNPIFNTMRTLYKSNKLLVGLIVQKRDEGILVKSLLKP